MRCKALADELRRQGADVRFVCRENRGHLIPLLAEAGYAVAALPTRIDVEQSTDAEETITTLASGAPDWLIVDHYQLDERWEHRLRGHVGRVFVIDDLADRPHECDVLLDQNWFGERTAHRYDHLVEGAECLLGPQYALLQPAFSRVRTKVPMRDGIVRRVLVFFGAVDLAHQTVKALQALQAPDLQDIVVDVVVGHANPDAFAIEELASAEQRIVLHGQRPTLADLMAEADLMLGAGGSTTWERCCLGLPAIVVVASENQRGSTAALADCGIHWSLGYASSVGVADWERALRHLRSEPALVRAYSVAARGLTDGLGAQRVAATVLNL